MKASTLKKTEVKEDTQTVGSNECPCLRALDGDGSGDNVEVVFLADGVGLRTANLVGDGWAMCLHPETAVEFFRACLAKAEAHAEQFNPEASEESKP